MPCQDMPNVPGSGRKWEMLDVFAFEVFGSFGSAILSKRRTPMHLVVPGPHLLDSRRACDDLSVFCRTWNIGL